MNDSSTAPTANTEAFFGISDWVFDGKWNSAGRRRASSKDVSHISLYYRTVPEPGVLLLMGAGLLGLGLSRRRRPA